MDRPFRVDDVPDPSDPYGISKLEAEQALFALSRDTGIEVSVIRPVLVYGPGVGANFRAMIKAVAKGIPLPLGAVRNRRSMVFVDNLVDLIRLAAIHPQAKGRIYLVSDGRDLSTTEMLIMLASAMGKPARLIPVPPKLLQLAAGLLGRGAVASRLLGSLTVDISPARDQLGWSPPVDVDAAFGATVAAFLSRSDHSA